MALFHFHATQVKRSAGQSVIASAAYRAGEKLYSEYYGDVSDYTRKGGVICSEILLPAHAPPEYADRQTLWNAVEKAERGKKAQLAYSFDIALQNEFSLNENNTLVRQFLLDNFVSRGMTVDFAVHQPDKEDGGISNPHFHVLCPIRPLKEDGTWDAKQHREYVLDADGNRVKDDAGNDVFNAVPTTDWDRPETLEAWRTAWAELCNAKFAEKGLECRIDNRSFVRQGLEQIPTVHEGPAVRRMEAKGIRTEKGELNRWIKVTNTLIRDAKRKIAALFSWLKEAKAELSKPHQPNLAELLGSYYTGRSAGAWSNKAKVGNIKQYSEIINFITAQNLYTPDDLEARLDTLNGQINGIKDSLKTKSTRMKELDELLRMVEYYAAGKPVYEKLNSIKFKKSRENYANEHENTLRLFYMAQRKLKPYFSESGKLPLTRWRDELAVLQQEYKTGQAELSPLYADVKKLWNIKFAVEKVLQEQNRPQHDREHKHDQER
ncbi:MAG TPA: MobQ family relaxase [Clostridia bacterium]|nr:MobQ family relaxase [Clostridia bacterium]